MQSVLLKRTNLSFVLMSVIADTYGSLRFSDIFSASRLLTLVHFSDIPPLVKTRGLNEDFWMSITLWWIYPSLFHVGRSVEGTCQNKTISNGYMHGRRKNFSFSMPCHSTMVFFQSFSKGCQKLWNLFFILKTKKTTFFPAIFKIQGVQRPPLPPSETYGYMKNKIRLINKWTI